MTATAVGHSITVDAGKTGEMKVAVKRKNGFKAKLKLAAKGLPEGVTAADVEVPEKDGEVALKLAARPRCQASEPADPTGPA